MLNIASERKRLGLSQEELGAKIGASRSAIKDWENGNTPIKSVNLIQMADLFGCSIDWLLGRSDERLAYHINR